MTIGDSGDNATGEWHKNFPLPVAMLDFSRFFESPLGEELLLIESTKLEQELRRVAGYIGIQISLARGLQLMPESAIGYTVLLGYAPAPQSKEDAWADMNQLPVSHDCADVVLLHHALEFSDEPTQVLREADRTLKPGGHIVVLSFNLLSGWPFYSRYWAWKNQVRWRRLPALRRGRLNDWLAALNYDVVCSEHLLRRPLINNAIWVKRTRWFERLISRLRLPIGMVHFTIAKKRTLPVNPILNREWGNAFQGASSMTNSRRAVKKTNNSSQRTINNEVNIEDNKFECL